MPKIYESIQSDQWLNAQPPKSLITMMTPVPAKSIRLMDLGFKKKGVENGKQDIKSKGRRKTEARAPLVKAIQEIAKLITMCAVLDHTEVLL